MSSSVRIRYEIQIESDITRSPAGTKSIKSVQAGTPTQALHKLLAYSRGGGTATYYVDFRCKPTPNVAYDGFSANGHTTKSGTKWKGELEIRPTLKRRQATPRFNLLTVPSPVHADTPSFIECTVRLTSRTTVLQTREPLSASDSRHEGKCTVTFDVTP